MRSASAAKPGSTGRFARLRAQGLSWVLGVPLLCLQYPLWFGEGGWLKVHSAAGKIDTQVEMNQRLQQRNAALLAEVSDLKQGRDAVEERARSELGMIAPDEWFVRVIPGASNGK
ncbi:MAG: cell division protein FtsB [Thiobacillus sp.]